MFTLLLKTWLIYIKSDIDHYILRFVSNISAFFNVIYFKFIKHNINTEIIYNFILLYLISIVKFAIIMFIHRNLFILGYKYYLLAGILIIIKTIIRMIFYTLILRSIISYVYSSNENYKSMDIYKISDPILHSTKNIFPLVYQKIDFSPFIMLAMFYIMNHIVAIIFPILWLII